MPRSDTAADEILGAPVTLILPELDERAALAEQRTELRARRKGGVELPVEATFSSWEADGERFHHDRAA